MPAGFTNAEAGGQINDAGDQARFLITGGSQNVAYLFRYIASTTLWQQLHPAGTGRLASYGTGSIDNRRNVTGTVLSTGVFAPGPTGFAQSLTDLLSPAYAGVSVVTGQ